MLEGMNVPNAPRPTYPRPKRPGYRELIFPINLQAF